MKVTQAEPPPTLGTAIENKRILVTGGAGFIGTSLARRLVGSNAITLADVGFDHNAVAFSELKGDTRVKRAEVDMLDTQQLARVAEDAQIVVHAAAVLGVREVVHNASRTLDVNYIGTSNLLKILSQSSCCERVILLSSSEVMGSNAFKTAEDGDCVLPSIRDPRWCYAISKLASEHLALAYYREKGLPVVVVRPFNVFGPGRIGDHAVLRFILGALRSQDLEITGDGTQIRAWCYVDDFCEGLLRCLEVEEAIGRAFNIGNPRNAVTVYELAKKTVSFCGSGSSMVFKSQPFRDIDVRVPDISLARDVLGFDPGVELEDGLARTIAWVKRHADALGPFEAA